MNEDGSVTLLLLAAGAVITVIAIATAASGQYLAAAGQAQNAADAAALAAAPVTFRPFGAVGTAREEAAIFAEANGSTLTACACRQDPSWANRTVEVTVRRRVRLVLFGYRSVSATSRAEFAPTLLLNHEVTFPPE